jgi:hypothetical protein
MWAKYDGKYPVPTQNEIINYMGGVPTNITQAVRAVNFFTNSMAFEVTINESDIERRNLALNTARIKLDGNIPSIFTTGGGVHAIIFCGAYGNYDGNNIIVEVMLFKDPNRSASEFKSDEYDLDYFINYVWISNPLNYYRREIALGNSRFGNIPQGNPEEELKTFYRYNGTYYGGPESYIPEGSQFVRISFKSNIELTSIDINNPDGTIFPYQKNISWQVGLLENGTHAEPGSGYRIKIQSLGDPRTGPIEYETLQTFSIIQ